MKIYSTEIYFVVACKVILEDWYHGYDEKTYIFVMTEEEYQSTDIRAKAIEMADSQKVWEKHNTYLHILDTYHIFN